MTEVRHDCGINAKPTATMSRQENDTVASPAHYTQGGIECIDAMESAMPPDQFEGYLRGNILKYTWRYDRKNGLQDLEKARWYLDKLIKKLTV